MNKPKTNFFQKIGLIKYCRWLRLIILSCLAILIISWSIDVGGKLQKNSTKPVDAFFVLGGSIRREIYVAGLAKQYPNVPILISQGSKDPCIWLIFQQEKAFLDKVWLEKCARSTFYNFFYSVPILQRWGAHKVKIITSPTHLPRAKWMAKIFFGSQGIWVDLELVKEKGMPGNHESKIKTTLDIIRSLLWIPLNKFIQTSCQDLIKLTDIDKEMWTKEGFECEYQSDYQLKKIIPKIWR